MKQGSIGYKQALELSAIVDKAIINAILKKKPSAKRIQDLIEDPIEIFEFYEELFNSDRKSANILSLLVSDKKLILEAQASDSNIKARAKKIFSGYLDTSFWSMNNKQKETKELEVKVYEIKKDASYEQIFTAVSNRLSTLCLTQSQISRFCEKYPDYLKANGAATFFLFKENNKYFVASVYKNLDSLDLNVVSFKSNRILSSLNDPRLVVPCREDS
ncbi:MAG: hypothetical protein ACLFNO_00940 [Parcubacteria group bacterium]